MVNLAKEEKNKAFLMYYEYKEYISLLPDDEKGKLLMALIAYAEDGIEPSFTDGLLMCFHFIKTRIDRDNMRYLKQCEANKTNGKKGGRPSKKQTVSTETERFSKEPNESEKNLNINLNLNKKNNKENMSTQEKPDTLNYENIFSLFNTICTDLPRVERLTDARKRRIKTAVKALKGDFKSFFAKVQASDFLTGRETNWKSNFDWILNSNNLVKILEGNYDNRREKPYAAGNTPERAGSFAEEKKYGEYF